MKIEGIKRGQTIELLEDIHLADGEEIILEIPDQQLASQKSGFGDGIVKFRQVNHLKITTHNVSDFAPFDDLEVEDWFIKL